MAIWPVYAPSLACCVLLTGPLIPTMASNNQDAPWWLIVAFLIGPVFLVITGVVVPICRPELLVSEDRRIDYLKIVGTKEVRGKQFGEPKPRSSRLVPQPPVEKGKTAAEKQQASHTEGTSN